MGIINAIASLNGQSNINVIQPQKIINGLQQGISFYASFNGTTVPEIGELMPFSFGSFELIGDRLGVVVDNPNDAVMPIFMNKSEGTIQLTLDPSSMLGIEESNRCYLFTTRNNNMNASFLHAIYEKENEFLKIYLYVDNTEVNLFGNLFHQDQQIKTIRITWKEEDYARLFIDGILEDEVMISNFNVSPGTISLADHIDLNLRRRSTYVTADFYILSKDIGMQEIINPTIIVGSSSFITEKVILTTTAKITDIHCQTIMSVEQPVLTTKVSKMNIEANINVIINQPINITPTDVNELNNVSSINIRPVLITGIQILNIGAVSNILVNQPLNITPIFVNELIINSSANTVQPIKITPIEQIYEMNIQNSIEVNAKKFKIVRASLQTDSKLESYIYDRFINQDIFDSIPKYYGSSNLMTDKVNAEANEFVRVNAMLYDLLDQLFIDTATWGLHRFETILGVTPHENSTFQERREALQFKRMKIKNLDVSTLEQLLFEYFYESIILEDNNNYKINIKIQEREIPDEDLIAVSEFIRGIIPAHMDFEFDFRYLEWNLLDLFTWEELEDLSWLQMLFHLGISILLLKWFRIDSSLKWKQLQGVSWKGLREYRYLEK
ncbi:putative phage tail protein [Chengkuizengella axinellae]|uniref:DUF2313 domain-containing protein n=1 Tax=Chengkuizengella axinellae TaxID=3064388 RepID=A0ABT9IWT0_9BACL|nr:putative phage tail protein [Chengkuizengella sp. 2205SS18-9]MDP5273557.1 DUF2313 domain-containing protein [Chengkuizengella sp. 2205SS18-9]